MFLWRWDSHCAIEERRLGRGLPRVFLYEGRAGPRGNTDSRIPTSGWKAPQCKLPGGIYLWRREIRRRLDLGLRGAWMYGALYLWCYYATGARTTSALRERARQRGNVVIDNAFAT